MDFFFQGFSTLQIVVLCISAVIIGINKTGMPGLGLLPVVMLANTFEPGLSTGLQLMMIAMADIPAIIYYRKTVNWKIILRLLPAALAGITSIDIKSREAGLLKFAERMHLPLRFYTAEELNQAEGKFTESAFVRQITGTDNVCELSAMLAAMTAGDFTEAGGSCMLLQAKTALNGVTAALAMKKGTIRFE